LFHSWFIGIEKVRGSYWALSRSFSLKNPFGVLWWSGDGKGWTPIQVFEGTPVWLQTDGVKNLSVGFLERESGVVLFALPDARQMDEWVRAGPHFALVERLFRSRP
jgi:hypothetical protein